MSPTYPTIRCRISPGNFLLLPRGFFFLICSVFRPLHLSCHFPSMLHASCSILELKPFILRVICSILELNLPCCMLFAALWRWNFLFCMLFAAFGRRNLLFIILFAAFARRAQGPFSLRAICRIWEQEPSIVELLYLLLRLLLVCLLLCCLLL